LAVAVGAEELQVLGPVVEPVAVLVVDVEMDGLVQPGLADGAPRGRTPERPTGFD
jgi:hypothetical protein